MAELVFLGTMVELGNRYFEPDYYLIVENADVRGSIAYHLVITLNPKRLTKNLNALTMQSSISKFSNWWISTSDLKFMKRFLKPINSFLYYKTKGVNDGSTKKTEAIQET